MSSVTVRRQAIYPQAGPEVKALFAAQSIWQSTSYKGIKSDESTSGYPITYSEFCYNDHRGEKFRISDEKELEKGLLICSGARVDFLDLETLEVQNLFSKFRNVVNCATFRSDGQLLLTADANGKVQIIDPKHKEVLRLFDGHRTACNRAFFGYERSQALSVGDDCNVVVYDITQDSPIWKASMNDAIRGLATNKERSLTATGANDGTIALWDLRTGNHKPISTLLHKKAVECVNWIPNSSGNALVSCGGSTVKFWDARMMQKERSWKPHLKTITHFQFSSDAKQMATSSLDGCIKIHFSEDWFKDDITTATVSSKKHEGYLTCAIAESRGLVFGGMESGKWKLWEEVSPNAPVAKPIKEPTKQHEVPANVQKWMERFHYRYAMGQAASRGSVRDYIGTVNELLARDALRQAMRLSNEEEFSVHLNFLSHELPRATSNSLSVFLVAATILFEEANRWIVSTPNLVILDKLNKFAYLVEKLIQSQHSLKCLVSELKK